METKIPLPIFCVPVWSLSPVMIAAPRSTAGSHEPPAATKILESSVICSHDFLRRDDRNATTLSEKEDCGEVSRDVLKRVRVVHCITNTKVESSREHVKREPQVTEKRDDISKSAVERVSRG